LKKIEGITKERQSRKVQPNGRETRDVTGANRGVLGSRHARDRTNGDGDGKPTADENQGNPGEMDEEELEKDVTMSLTTAEIETGAAASNNLSNLAQLRQVLCVDQDSAGDGTGSEGRLISFAGAAAGERESWNQSPGI